MTVEFCTFSVRGGFTRLRAVLPHFIVLFMASLSLVDSSTAQALPCVSGPLPTTDPRHPQQLIQICIPPVRWNGQLVIYAMGSSHLRSLWRCQLMNLLALAATRRWRPCCTDSLDTIERAPSPRGTAARSLPAQSIEGQDNASIMSNLQIPVEAQIHAGPG